MRFEEIYLDKEIGRNVGLDEIDLKRLGAVVALVGKNGAGKTRVLDLLKNQVIPSIDVAKLLEGKVTFQPIEITSFVQQMDQGIKDLFILESRIAQLNLMIGRDPNNDDYRLELNRLSQRYNHIFTVQNYSSHFINFKRAHGQVISQIPSIISKYFIKIEYQDIIELKKNISNTEKSGMVPLRQLINKTPDNSDYNILKSINETSLNYLNSLPTQLSIDQVDCLTKNVNFEEQPSFKSYVSLKKIIKAFLNLDLTWGSNVNVGTFNNEGAANVNYQGIWKLNEQVFNYDSLSPGQKTLFTYCMLFYLIEQNSNLKISESIVIIDEPELHLHPESELDVIKGIRNIIKDKGQLWIATHSVNILSHLSHDEIFLIKDKKIIPPSRTTPHNSLIELVGDQAEQFSHFITNLSNWSYLNFMTQNFNNPDTIESARANDPQVEVFKQSLRENNENAILLDFGAGKGRMLKEIKSEEELSVRIKDFYAIEPNKDNQEHLREIGVIGCYDNYEMLPEDKFDYILLCNVLHEIEPINEWPNILNKLISALKSNGFIILIEDQVLPKGEKIGKEGFIVMDATSLKVLFGLKNEPSKLVSSQSQFKERILCALIKKEEVRKISIPMVRAALDNLKENTFKKIKSNRDIIPTDDNKIVLGRESAFYSQLYINCLLAIEKLG